MKKRTLNQTWTLCLRMWRSIAKKWKQNQETDITLISEFKRTWLRENGFAESHIEDNCFFCDYNSGGSSCSTCPGTFVDPSFRCGNSKYSYSQKPVEFYAELLRLNRIRKEKK